MRLSEGVAGAALVVLVTAGGTLVAAAPSGAGELDAVRQECVGAAGDTQAREQTLAALEHAISLLRRDADGRQRDLDESRTEQAHLLGTLAFLARNPPDAPTSAPEGAIERNRGELLLHATLPVLRAQAHALSSEIERIAALREQIATRNNELASTHQALATDRAHLAGLVAHRLELTRRMQPEEVASDARIAALERDASDIGELIKRADAATEHRDKEVRAAAPKVASKAPTGNSNTPVARTGDPTRPRELRAFDPPHSVLTMPVAGTITRRFGAEGAPMATGGPSQGLSLAVVPGAETVAPFDGRVIYAGPFRYLGLVLIIRYGTLYHSLLAGLERVDVTPGQWVVAGEPVGAMPDAPGGVLYFELRRDYRPVDPQPWLTPDALGRDQEREAGRNEPIGDKKVRE